MERQGLSCLVWDQSQLDLLRLEKTSKIIDSGIFVRPMNYFLKVLVKHHHEVILSFPQNPALCRQHQRNKGS